MNLQITDIGWGIDRRTGESSESEVANVCFPIKEVGPLPPVGPSKHVFVINEIGEDCILITCSSKREPVRIEVGKGYIYRPLSMDGGHYFKLNLE